MVLTGTADNDTVQGYASDDTLNGGAGNDTLYARAGNDTVLGGGDNDNLHGEAGNDTLKGEAGDDILSGGAGDDTLDGGTGNDILVGSTYWSDPFSYPSNEAGNDTYLFGRGDGQDRIVDVDTSAGNVDKLVFKAGVAVADVARPTRCGWRTTSTPTPRTAGRSRRSALPMHRRSFGVFHKSKPWCRDPCRPSWPYRSETKASSKTPPSVGWCPAMPSPTQILELP
nr:calcium-binding protein [Pseudorhodoferax sp. Leaf265]